MKLVLHPHALPLRHPFTLSRSTVTVQHTLIVELQQDGVSGLGEATQNAYYGVTVDDMVRKLQALAPLIEPWTLRTPAELWARLCLQLRGHPFAQCALDEAAHDLHGKLLGRSLRAVWGLPDVQLPPSSFTIGIDATDVMARKLQEMPGWPVYKIKLGTERDLEIVAELRRLTPAPFRVDANGGWSVEQVRALDAPLRQLGVELVEQPLPTDAWESMRVLRTAVQLPHFADESCRGADDVSRCPGAFSGVNIKLTKCGGLTPARELIGQARRAGPAIMLGCMTETSVGISAAAQLLPLVDFADLDGALLLAQDIADGVRVERGRVRYASAAGCGATLL